MKIHIHSLLFLTLIWSCSQDQAAKNKFQDETLIKIYDLKDKRDTQGLTAFLYHENENYRAEAALAFGSIQDTLILIDLYDLLGDPVEKVRLAAAYSIGQTRQMTSKERLKKQLENETSEIVRHELLIAYGKCTNSSGLDYLTDYDKSDDTTIKGQAWGLYQAGLNRVLSEKGTKRLTQLLNHPNKEVQLAASNYFSRFQVNNVSEYESDLMDAYKAAGDSEIKMNLARALGKIESGNIQRELIKALKPSDDGLVLVNTLRALNPKYEVEYKEAVKDLILSANTQVSVVATNVFIKGKGLHVKEIESLIKEVKNNRSKADLYNSLIALKKVSISPEIKSLFESSKDVYFKGELLKALAYDSTQLAYITKITFSTGHPYLKTSGITAIQRMLVNAYGTKKEMASIFKKSILSKDIGLISAAASTLSDTTNGLHLEYENFDFLHKAKEGLTLPLDAEAMIAIQRVIDIYEGASSLSNFDNPYNNPIDWNAITSIPKDQKVILHTDQGDITWQLKVEESPGTVEFFLRLASKGFYDGLNFHRVVSNFVAQGGCPRGDGFGGTSESIRSEFGLTRYKTGSVGVASAGKDTESCQFFMTHSPTPHLNGRYTIFAEVIEGMEIVQKLELGSKIIAVEIL